VLSRRQLLATSAGLALAPRVAAAAHSDPTAGLVSPHFTVRDIRLTAGKPTERFTLLVPKISEKRPVPLVVLLHGLGETHDPEAGVYAWLRRYGLATAYNRLHAPPIEALGARHWTATALAKTNAELAERPFGGFAIACPYTPNVYRARSRRAALDRYADWISDVVVPRARVEANIIADSGHTSIDGCSLGGYVGLEVFLRKPEIFHAWGSVQGALGMHRIAGYVERLAAAIAKHGPRRIHLETSDRDAFRKDNERLSRALSKASIPHDFSLLRGPHNQPFLRDSGTIHMLMWHDRLYGRPQTHVPQGHPTEQ
jgi:predicted esterase